MKLESIKNEKFVMTNNEMGKLVGGEQFYVGSGPGAIKQSDGSLFKYSADAISYASERDYNRLVSQGMGYYFATIGNDTALRDERVPCRHVNRTGTIYGATL